MARRRKLVRYTIPTLGSSITDIGSSDDPLFALWAEVARGDTPIVLDFSDCIFLPHYAVAFLGGLARLAANCSSSLTFDWSTLKPDVSSHLQKNGFVSAFAGGRFQRSGTVVPYREDFVRDKQGLMTYLLCEWLGVGRIQLSDRLRRAIAGNVAEIYDNAFAHGASPIGVMSCGQHYPRYKQLQLTVVDFGVGIPYNVRTFTGHPRMHAATTLKWAFKAGNTTLPGMGRGLGLDLLKEFVRLNRGRLDVFSDLGHVSISGAGETFENRSSGFRGTLVNLMLQCDERLYQLAEEAQQGPLF